MSDFPDVHLTVYPLIHPILIPIFLLFFPYTPYYIDNLFVPSSRQGLSRDPEVLLLLIVVGRHRGNVLAAIQKVFAFAFYLSFVSTFASKPSSRHGLSRDPEGFRLCLLSFICVICVICVIPAYTRRACPVVFLYGGQAYGCFCL